MREIQRYIITTSPGGLCMAEPSDAGSWCSYSHVEFYKRQYWMAVFINIVVVLACAVLAALLVQEKAARGPVAVEQSVLSQERDAHAKREQDLMKERTIYQSEIKRLNNELALKTERLGGLATRIDSAVVAGEKVSELNKEMAAKMSTSQGVVLEAKRILGPLGVRTVKVVEP